MAGRRRVADAPVGRDRMTRVQSDASSSAELIRDSRDGDVGQWAASNPMAQTPRQRVGDPGKPARGSAMPKPQSAT